MAAVAAGAHVGAARAAESVETARPVTARLRAPATARLRARENTTMPFVGNRVHVLQLDGAAMVTPDVPRGVLHGGGTRPIPPSADRWSRGLRRCCRRTGSPGPARRPWPGRARRQRGR